MAFISAMAGAGNPSLSMCWRPERRHAKLLPSGAKKNFFRIRPSTVRVFQPATRRVSPRGGVSGSGSRIFPNCGSGSRVLKTKNCKSFTAEKKLYIFLSKIAIYLFLASKQDAEPTGEAFGPQKRDSSTSKHEISKLFSIFVGNFLPPGSGRGSSNSNKCDPCGSGSETPDKERINYTSILLLGLEIQNKQRFRRARAGLRIRGPDNKGPNMYF